MIAPSTSGARRPGASSPSRTVRWPLQAAASRRDRAHDGDRCDRRHEQHTTRPPPEPAIKRICRVLVAVAAETGRSRSSRPSSQPIPNAIFSQPMVRRATRPLNAPNRHRSERAPMSACGAPEFRGVGAADRWSVFAPADDPPVPAGSGPFRAGVGVPLSPLLWFGAGAPCSRSPSLEPVALRSGARERRRLGLRGHRWGVPAPGPVPRRAPGPCLYSCGSVLARVGLTPSV